MFGFFWHQFRWGFDSIYDSNFWFWVDWVINNLMTPTTTLTMSPLDHERSLFCLSPSSKTRENAHARHWRRETEKALFSSRSAALISRSLMRVANWRKKRDCSQSMTPLLAKTSAEGEEVKILQSGLHCILTEVTSCNAELTTFFQNYHFWGFCPASRKALYVGSKDWWTGLFTWGITCKY